MDTRGTVSSTSAPDQNAPKKPNKIIPVPHEFRRLSHLRERQMIVNELKISTGCTVIPKWDQGRIYQFGIVGTGAGLEKAVWYINQWISKAHIKSMDSAAWAKTPAFDTNKWYYEEVEVLELERKQVFRESAPEGETSLMRMVVDWPVELTNEGISPRDVFKNKLEALDAIRMQNEVYISLLPATGGVWQIEIQASEDANIEAAEVHLKTMIDMVKAEETGLQNTLNMILDDREGLEVVLGKADAWWPNHQDQLVPRLLPSGMMELPGSFRSEILHYTQLSRIQRSFQLALDAVRHRKGAYDMVIRLGCLAMSSQQVKDDQVGKQHKKENFLKSVDRSVGLDVKKWLVDDALGFQLSEAICLAEDLLEPTKSASYFGYMPESLNKTRPMLRGTWVFSDPSSAIAPTREPARHSGRPPVAPGQKPVPNPVAASSPNIIVVQIDWTDDEEGLYEKTSSRFYRLEQGAKVPKKHMDINLLELGESRGWHFALESLIPATTKSISPVLTDFAERVKMRSNYDHQSVQSFATWENTPTVKKYLQTGRLDAIYSFGIRKTCYKVELTRMWYPTGRLPTWGLAVRHTEWATHLAELERLPVGRKADWGDTIATFLPDDGQSLYTVAGDNDFGMENLKIGSDEEAPPPRDGIRILMDKLLQLSTIISSVTDTSGGVGI